MNSYRNGHQSTKLNTFDNTYGAINEIWQNPFNVAIFHVTLFEAVLLIWNFWICKTTNQKDSRDTFLVRCFTKLKNSDQFWLEGVNLAKRRTKNVSIGFFWFVGLLFRQIQKCQISKTASNKVTWKIAPSNEFCQI